MQLQKKKFPVFRFSDPRQQQIYEELKEIVGPGPAAFFHDDCWLMANHDTLDTTPHLVTHLLREVESALRSLFRAIVITKLTDQALFKDVGMRQEYVLLLQDCFPRLTQKDQAKILGWIERGPEVAEWKQRQESETIRQPS